MRTMAVKELLAAVGGVLLSGSEEDSFSQVGSDSRSVTPGMLFLPVVGEKTDGHRFIEAALSAGASGCLCQQTPEHFLPGKFYVQVPDTRLALKALAGWYRQQFSIPFIQITGSVGKTTTKEMIASVLEQRYTVLKTRGNLNNELGAPCTLLELTGQHQVAVIETGMDHFNEIRYLGEMIRPEIAVITNIGDAHLENLGSREGILQAKCEIFDYLSPEGFAVLNGDDALLNTVQREVELLRCGESAHCHARAEQVEDLGLQGIRCVVRTARQEYPLAIPAPGRHMLYPAAMAVLIGERLGLTPEEICRGVAAYEPTGSRMRVIPLSGGRLLLDDCYNASPQSMGGALEILSHTDCRRKLAVLGDMNELGSASLQGHRSMGQLCARLRIDTLFAIGEKSRDIAAAAKEAGMKDVHWYADKTAALEEIAAAVDEGSAVLVKASHAMEFEEITKRLMNDKA